MSNNTVMIRLQKGTYSRDFLWRVIASSGNFREYQIYSRGTHKSPRRQTMLTISGGQLWDHSFDPIWGLTVLQIPQCTCPASHSTHHIWTEMCTWCIMGYGPGALWDSRHWSIVDTHDRDFVHNSGRLTNQFTVFSTDMYAHKNHQSSHNCVLV